MLWQIYHKRTFTCQSNPYRCWLHPIFWGLVVEPPIKIHHFFLRGFILWSSWANSQHSELLQDHPGGLRGSATESDDDEIITANGFQIVRHSCMIIYDHVWFCLWKLTIVNFLVLNRLSDWDLWNGEARGSQILNCMCVGYDLLTFLIGCQPAGTQYYLFKGRCLVRGISMIITDFGLLTC